MYNPQVESASQRKSERIFVLQPMQGKNTLTNKGMVDNRLFTGDNNLRAIKNPVTNLWRLKYDVGNVPPALRQMFTRYHVLYETVERYFKNRNIEIVKVID